MGLSIGIDLGARKDRKIQERYLDLKRREMDALYGPEIGVDATTGAGAMAGEASGRTGGLEDRKISTTERLAEIQKQLADVEAGKLDIAKQQQPISQMNFSTADVLQLKSHFQKTYGDPVTKSFEKVFNVALGLGEKQGANRGWVLDHLIANREPLYRDIKTRASKEWEKLVADGKETTAEGQALLQIIKSLDQDTEGHIIKRFFPGVVRERMMEEAELATKMKEPQETWGPLAWDDRTQSYIQQSSLGKGASVGKTPTGMRLSYDSEGRPILETGVSTGGGGAPTKPTQNLLQQKIIEDRDALQKVGNIINEFKGKYQTLPFRAAAEWEGLKQKFGAKPDPQMADQLQGFKSWYKKAMRDYGIAIQTLGKGNLTKNEQKLYGAGLPDPGTGLWPKDAPSVYYDAIVDRYKGLNAAIARYNYYLKDGLSHDDVLNLIKGDKVISLDEMNRIIDERGKQLEEEIKSMNPSISAEELFMQVKAQLAKDFGMGG